jgi:hypothetical protein
VKIRGTPAHIAEKYLTLARDAQSSGDPVLAENYLQHAEHYSRIIMAYREQLQQHGGDMANGNGQRLRGPGEGGEGEDFGDDDGGDDMLDDGFSQPPMPQHHGQQHQGQPHQQNRHTGYDANRDRPFRRDQNRFRDRDRNNDRGDRNDRNDRGDRDRQPVEGRPSPAAQERQPDAPAEVGGEPRRRDRFQQPHEQPEFLRRPVRRGRAEGNGEPATPAKEEPRD